IIANKWPFGEGKIPHAAHNTKNRPPRSASSRIALTGAVQYALVGTMLPEFFDLGLQFLEAPRIIDDPRGGTSLFVEGHLRLFATVDLPGLPAPLAGKVASPPGRGIDKQNVIAHFAPTCLEQQRGIDYKRRGSRRGPQITQLQQTLPRAGMDELFQESAVASGS